VLAFCDWEILPLPDRIGKKELVGFAALSLSLSLSLLASRDLDESRIHAKSDGNAKIP